jgi:hypothetical protein
MKEVSRNSPDHALSQRYIKAWTETVED